MESLKAKLAAAGYPNADIDDVLSYALFPAVAKDFFEYREAQQTGVDPKKADKENKVYPV